MEKKLDMHLDFYYKNNQGTLLPQGFPGGSDGKESVCNAGDPHSIRGSGRSPGEGNDYLFQYSCLGNPIDRGAWWGLQPMGSQRVGPHWVINIPVYIITPKPVLERPLHVELGTFQKDSKFASVYI